MSKKFINIKDGPKSWKAKNDKPKAFKLPTLKAISELKKARSFIVYFNGRTEGIDYAIAHLEKNTTI